MEPDYYKILGVSNKATHSEINKAAQNLVNKIKKAFQEGDCKVLGVVPNSDKETMKVIAQKKINKIKKAYSILGKIESRKKYDEKFCSLADKEPSIVGRTNPQTNELKEDSSSTSIVTLPKNIRNVTNKYLSWTKFTTFQANMSPENIRNVTNKWLSWIKLTIFQANMSKKNKISIVFFFIVLIFLFFILSGSGGKVVVTKYDIFTKGISEVTWEASVRGSVQNIGENDVKNVVVGFVCHSCAKDGEDIEGKWVSLTAGNPYRQDKISYLAAGNKEEFEFDIGITVSIDRPSYAPNVEIKIVSFEQAE